jgi:hypothetical protein
MILNLLKAIILDGFSVFLIEYSEHESDNKFTASSNINV